MNEMLPGELLRVVADLVEVDVVDRGLEAGAVAIGVDVVVDAVGEEWIEVDEWRGEDEGVVKFSSVIFWHGCRNDHIVCSLNFFHTWPVAHLNQILSTQRESMMTVMHRLRFDHVPEIAVKIL